MRTDADRRGCSWCNDTGEVGPPEDRYVCPCPAGEAKRWRARAEAAEQQLQALRQRCVCQIEDGLVQEWVSKARAVAKSKGYSLAQPGAADCPQCGAESAYVTGPGKVEGCASCGYTQPGAAGQE